jgi:hypothetical protein
MNERPLASYTVNLSISESDDSLGRGFPLWQVNRVTLQVTAALFGQGANVVFGHDWREDGVMETIHGFALQVQPPIPLLSEEAVASGQPLLRNILPWPDKPRLSNDDLERLVSTLRVELAGLPAEVAPYENEARRLGASSPLYQYVRARGLTHLRRRLNAESDVRLCIGGRTEGSAGRYPGVIEEALLAIQVGKPLFLAGFLGGATQQVTHAIEGRDMPEDFCRPGPINELYETPPIVETDRGTQIDRSLDRRALWVMFRQAGVAGLVERNHLNPKKTKSFFALRFLIALSNWYLQACHGSRRQTPETWARERYR